jgi:hypothetical protein
MDFQHAKMTYMAELDNNIRYYRSGLHRVIPEEKDVIKQLIAFMNACKQMHMNSVEVEKMKLKNMIGNMLYEALESGRLSKEFSIVWTTTIHQANMYYNKCHLICSFMHGGIEADEYSDEEKRSTDEMVKGVQGDISFETLEILVSP